MATTLTYHDSWEKHEKGGKHKIEKTISITFGRGEVTDKTYAYKLAPSLHDATLTKGDKMIVQVGDNHSCMVGLFVEVHATPDPAATKWAFQLVDEERNRSLPRG